MTKKFFEDLEIRKLWNELALELWNIFYNKSFKNFDFQSQIMRATISITNNIAEWHERHTNKEYLYFLYISKWSCGEVRSMLYLAHKFWYITQEQFEYFKHKCMNISAKIYNFISYLKKNSYK